MRTSRKFLILAAMFFAALQVNAQDVNESLKPFKEVKTFNGIDVVVYPSKENRINITGHSKNEVKYEIVEGRLEIRLSLDNLWSKDNTLIKVYGNSIETIDANEGSKIQVNGELKGENLTFRAQEGATIDAEVEAKKVESKAISGGKITLDGKADSQQVEANSGGHFYGKDLKTKDTDVSAGTAGKAEVYVTGYCRATAKVGGVVKLYGNPDEVDRKTSLGGKIL
ncbi:MAG: head GIN domain-containing protein [Salinimicrobium sp.]